VREALAKAGEIESRFYEGELDRLEGELVLALAKPDESGAQTLFRKAIALARKRGVNSRELRAAESLARLLARQGRREEAPGLLQASHLWLVHPYRGFRALAHRRLTA
jgi:predicted ATPase